LKLIFQRERKLNAIRERARTENDIFLYSQIDEFVLKSSRGIPDMLRAMYQGLNGSKTPKFFGDKLPTYYKEDLSDLYAVTKFRIIFVSRNPHDVVRSMMFRAENARGKRDHWSFARTPEQGIIEWVSAVRFAATCRYEKLIVRYEDLVFNSEATASVIAEFLKVENSFNLDIIRRGHKVSDKQYNIINSNLPFGEIAKSWCELSIGDVYERISKYPKGK